MISDFWDEFKIGLLAVLAAILLGGFLIGMVQAYEHKKCEYPSIISYLPTRILGCELTKERWSEK